MNSPASRTSTTATVLAGPRFGLRAAAWTSFAAALLAPLAYWTHGIPGVAFVTAAALVIVTSGWCATVFADALAGIGRPMAAYVVAMGLRMACPLGFTLVVAIWGGSFVPAQTVLYVVPLYLAMLLAETLTVVRHCDGRKQASPSMPAAPVAGGQR